MSNDVRVSIRLPKELHVWLVDQKNKDASSVNYEVVRSVRERKQQEQTADA